MHACGFHGRGGSHHRFDRDADHRVRAWRLSAVQLGLCRLPARARRVDAALWPARGPLWPQACLRGRRDRISRNTGSAACGFAQNMFWLVLFRIFQGFGAGSIQSIAITIVGDIVPRASARQGCKGWLSGVWGVAAIAGPALGAFIVQHLHWAFVFWINLPIGITAIAITSPCALRRRNGAAARASYCRPARSGAADVRRRGGAGRHRAGEHP